MLFIVDDQDGGLNIHGFVAQEHRHFACVPSGNVFRCANASGFQIRWAHRLQVYVPNTLYQMLDARFLLSIKFAPMTKHPPFAKAWAWRANSRKKREHDYLSLIIRHCFELR